MAEALAPLPFVPEDDPVIPLPSAEVMEAALREAPEEFVGWLKARQEEIGRRNADPFKHGFEPAIWHVVDDLLVRGKRVVLIDPVDGTPREILGGSEVYISGGNRASKTDYAAKRLVRKLVEKARARTWAFHTTGPSSIAMQQPRVWHYLPTEWKALKRHQVADIKYGQKNGFAGVTPTFVGPNGSQCWFKNYAQGLETLEGEELDLAWVDELVPMEIIDALQFRLATRNGVLIITFTAVDGYTATVKGLIDGAKDVLRVPALELPVTEEGSTNHTNDTNGEAKAGPTNEANLSECGVELSGGVEGRHAAQRYASEQVDRLIEAPVLRRSSDRPAQLTPAKLERPGTARVNGVLYETVPRVQQASYGPRKIVYFHVFDNVFGNPPEIVSKARAKGREGILLRVYGVPTKAIGAMFPTFRRDVHVVPASVLASLGEGINKHYVDPCSGRNWFHIWARAVPDGRIVIYREWPSPGRYIGGVGDPGAWAEPDGKLHDGKRGDAQKPWGFGLIRYATEILREEGWREHDIDVAMEASDCTLLPRRDVKNGALPVEEIAERMMDSRFGNSPTLSKSESKTLIESMDEIGMHFEPAPGEHQREGIDQINDLLFYDVEKPVDFANRPRLLITENCRNLIWALENWTGLDGAHGASKDPIDLLRYMALSPPEWYPPEALYCRGGGSY